VDVVGLFVSVLRSERSDRSASEVRRKLGGLHMKVSLHIRD
jgi:hypothetical protein